MNKVKSLRGRTALALTLVGLLAACASAPTSNAKLQEARAAYDQAAADPQVVRSASLELQQAQQALAKAEAALRAGDDVSLVEHQSYLARQRVEVARQAGLIAQADQAVAASRSDRDRIVIEARTREAQSQRDSAVQARVAADTARTQAETARAQAETARKQAEEQLAAAEAARLQATKATSRATTLEAQMAELKAKQTNRGMVLTLGDVLFDSGQATLKSGAMRTVDQLARFLDNNPSRKVLVEGYTDSVGSDAFNLDLSQRRAEAVRMALLDRRIGSQRIDVSGLGEAYPVANNGNAAGRQQNRRIEIIFSDESGAIKTR